MAFRCTSDQGLDLCLQGGACNATTGICDCVPGWSHDVSYFHDGNCALPDGVFLYFMAISVATTVVCFGILLPSFARTRPGPIRSVHVAAFGLILAFMGQMVSLYLQNGWMQAACALNLVVIGTLSYAFLVFTRVLVLPLFASQAELQRKVWLATLAWHAAMLTVVVSGNIVTIVASPFAQREAYNRAALTPWIATVGIMVYSHVAIHIASDRLIAIINASAPSPTSLGTVARLRANQRRLLLTLPVVCVGALLIVVIHPALGSIPYFWVVVLLQFSAAYPLTAAAVVYTFGQRLERAPALHPLSSSPAVAVDVPSKIPHPTSTPLPRAPPASKASSSSGKALLDMPSSPPAEASAPGSSGDLYRFRNSPRFQRRKLPRSDAVSTQQTQGPVDVVSRVDDDVLKVAAPPLSTLLTERFRFRLFAAAAPAPEARAPQAVTMVETYVASRDSEFA